MHDGTHSRIAALSGQVKALGARAMLGGGDSGPMRPILQFDRRQGWS
jgi:hypothetical protein